MDGAQIANQVRESFSQIRPVFDRESDQVRPQFFVLSAKVFDPCEIHPQSLSPTTDGTQGAKQMLFAGAYPAKPGFTDREILTEGRVIGTVAEIVSELVLTYGRQIPPKLKCVFLCATIPQQALE